jgi:hypothetical protein
MSNIAFTLCSINYLAQATGLSESMKKTNPSWRFIIGIVDKNVQNIDLSFVDAEIVWVDELAIAGFDEMVKKYNVVELLTSVKPFYFNWFLKQSAELNNVVYFDPDILVFQPLTDLEQKLEQYDIILTPHYTTPITDACIPTELHIMQTGIYNLGFLAVRNTENTKNLMDWWSDKLSTQCIINLSRGLFVDQLWMNLTPVYFEKVLIDKYSGYNMAHWNIHERFLSVEKDGYYVNGVPLVFYHFSHYNPAKPNEIAAFHNRFNFESRTDLKEIYDTYHKGLLTYNFFKLKKTPCYFVKDEKKKKRKKELENFLRVAMPGPLKTAVSKLLKRRYVK